MGGQNEQTKVPKDRRCQKQKPSQTVLSVGRDLMGMNKLKICLCPPPLQWLCDHLKDGQLTPTNPTTHDREQL